MTFTDLNNEIIPSIGSFPQPAALRRLYRGARIFCERAEVWRHNQTQSIVADQEDYVLTFPSNADDAFIKRLAVVWYGEDSVNRRNGDIVNTSMYRFTYPTTLTFFTAYGDAVTNGLTTEIIMIPDLDTLATEGPSAQVMNNWGLRGFATWAVWDICSEKNKPWSDPDIAERNRIAFLRAISEARTENERGYMSGDLRVTAREFV